MNSIKTAGKVSSIISDNPLTLSLRLTPTDNLRLSNLCGPLDENLRQLSYALEVNITRRSERFTIRGEAPAARQAKAALQHLYERSQSPLSQEDVQLELIESAQQRSSVKPGNKTTAAEREPTSNDMQLLTSKGECRGRTAQQINYLQAIRDHDITIATGPAGTGKTYLAVASAVDAFERDQFERIILTRPAVEAGERLGFLPGDLSQKVDPYLRPLYDALYELMGFDKVTRLLERGRIEVAPLAFMRGRTLNRAFIILDEAQNTTPEQMKMFLTRVGLGSKAVVNGDLTQVDLARDVQSGLKQANEVLRQVHGISLIQFGQEDVVRHPLIARIVVAYEGQQPA